MGARWMRRGPFKCVRVGFACERKTFYKMLRQSGVRKTKPPAVAGVVSAHDSATAIVWLSRKSAGKRAKEYLVHEATHVRQCIERCIGERLDGEVEAYVQQWISAWLWKCLRQSHMRGGKKKGR